MMYEEEIKNVILDSLQNRLSSIALCVGKLLEEGYLPNNKKQVQLSFLSILSSAYTHINSFTKEQQDKLDKLYNNIVRL